MKREQEIASLASATFGRPDMPPSGDTAPFIYHYTAAAAVKAAASALLTNRIVRRVRVSLPDGRITNFKVEKCSLEQDSAVCSVVSKAAEKSGDALPEISVRVAWEAGLPVTTNRAKTSLPLVHASEVAPDQQPEIYWIELQTPLAGSADSDTVGRLVPVLLYLAASNEAERDLLHSIPRDLLESAIRESLSLVAHNRLDKGVRVILSLTQVTSTLPTLPVQTFSLAEMLVSLNRQGVTRLALALDDIGSEAVNLILNPPDESGINLATHALSLSTALHGLRPLESLRRLTICGSTSAMVAVASGHVDDPTNPTLDPIFINALSSQRDLDPAIVHTLRQIASPSELVQLLGSRRLGWLFDEICRMAAVEIRKHYFRDTRLETIIFGKTGAMLGRTVLDPGVFRL